MYQQQSPPEPPPPNLKYVWGVLTGIAILGIAYWVFRMGTWPRSDQTAEICGGFLVCLALAVWFGVMTSNADEAHVKKMKLRAEARAAHLVEHQTSIRLTNARIEDAHRAVVDHHAREANIARLNTDKARAEQERREIALRQELMPIAQQYGVDINTVIKIQEAHYLAQIGDQSRLRQKMQDIGLGAYVNRNVLLGEVVTKLPLFADGFYFRATYHTFDYKRLSPLHIILTMAGYTQPLPILYNSFVFATK